MCNQLDLPDNPQYSIHTKERNLFLLAGKWKVVGMTEILAVSRFGLEVIMVDPGT